MRLAAKLVLLFLVGLLLIVGLFAFLTIRQDRQYAIDQHQRLASDLAATLRPSIDDALRDQKLAELPELLAQSTSQLRHVRVRWVEFVSGGDRSRQPLVPMDMIVTQREITTVSMPDLTGLEHLYTYIPVTSDESTINSAGIEISAPNIDTSKRFRRSLISSLIALLGVTTLSGIVILYGGVKMVGKPLNQLIEKVHRVGNGDFGQPVNLDSNDELGQLAVALNEMCGQLADQRQQIERDAVSRVAVVEHLRRAERLKMVGQMAAGVAHEIGTPLNVIAGRAEMIASGQLTADESRASGLTIRSEAQRITKTIRSLLDFARQSTPNRSKQNLSELIESTANLMNVLVAKHDTKLTIELPERPLFADVDSGQVQQVLTNLIINAAQAIDRNGRIIVSLSSQTDSAGADLEQDPGPERGNQTYCRITITDNGKGISQSDRQRIFEPFFTTKDVGEGTGLGLSISLGIVQEHDGWISVESELGQGSCFTIFLPTAINEGAIG